MNPVGQKKAGCLCRKLLHYYVGGEPVAEQNGLTAIMRRKVRMVECFAKMSYRCDEMMIRESNEEVDCRKSEGKYT